MPIAICQACGATRDLKHAFRHSTGLCQSCSASFILKRWHATHGPKPGPGPSLHSRIAASARSRAKRIPVTLAKGA